MDNKILFGKVHIVEWLGPGDRRTGRELFDELEPIGLLTKPEIAVDFARVSTRAEFVALLRTFEDDLRATGRIPALHIETHGSDGGIGGSDTEGLSFPELMEELIPLDVLSRLNLFVVLAACEGVWGIKMLQPVRRAAYRMLIGPNREMYPDELARGCTAFYRTLFRERSAEMAFKAMNDAVDPAKPTFNRVSAEMAFKMVYRGFLKDLCTRAAKEKRVLDVEAQEIARRRSEGLPAMTRAEIEQGRERARQFLSDDRAPFEKFRRDFFMIDLCPENDARFDLKIEDCQPEL